VAAFQRWETVRLVLAPEIVGSTALSCGDEGQFAGLGWSPEQIVMTQAAIGSNVLDEDVRQHKFDRRRRWLVEAFMYQKPMIGRHIEKLSVLFEFFHTIRRRLAFIPYEATGFNVEQYRAFKARTVSLIIHAPPMSLCYNPEGGTFQNTYYLPSVPTKALPVPEPPSIYTDGHQLMRCFGIAGHPIMRTVEMSGVILPVLTAPKSYIAPIGSPKRERISMIAFYRLLTQLEAIKPGIIDAFLTRDKKGEQPVHTAAISRRQDSV
jgi:hypothetical protein